MKFIFELASLVYMPHKRRLVDVLTSHPLSRYVLVEN